MFTEHTLCTPARFPKLFTLFEAGLREWFRVTFPSLRTNSIYQPVPTLSLSATRCCFTKDVLRDLRDPHRWSVRFFFLSLSLWKTPSLIFLNSIQPKLQIYILLFLAETLNWRICPDVYVKRFVICKLSIATCSSEGGGWMLACLLYFGVVSAPRASFQHATLSLMRRET